MKARQGFVSNSSSSSFIINFDNGKPRSKDELQKLLFGERKEYHDPHGTSFYSTDDTAEFIWNQLNNTKPATREEILETIERGYPIVEPWFMDLLEFKYPEFNDYQHGDKTNWDAWERDHRIYCNQFMKMFLEENEYYILEFSDNDGHLNSAIEHGTALDRVHPFRVSHH